MNYTKPEVAVLGAAVRVIENSSNKTQHLYSDGTQVKAILPAYDLDE
jgi:hypothetical protein